MVWEKRWLLWSLGLLVACTPVATGESIPATPFLPTRAEIAVVNPVAGGESAPAATSIVREFTPLPATNTPRPTMTPPAPVTTRDPAAPPLMPTGIPPTRLPGPSDITPTYPADDPDYQGRTIEALTLRSYGRGDLSTIRTMENAGPFMRYEFRYDSDGEVVGGFLNVPHEGDALPVVLVLHGYVNPSEYDLLAYTATYADALARAGFMVFHPNYRHHPPDGDEPPYNTFRVDYAVDVLNLVSFIRSGSVDPDDPLRRVDSDRLFLFGHSMGGGIAQRVMTVRPEWIQAAVLYASMSGDERRNYERIREWAGERHWGKEVFAPETVLAAVSPLNFIDRWIAPVAVHHGTGDEIVPPEWSAELCAELTARRHPVACFEYKNYPHNFYGPAETLLIDRTVRFFNEQR